MRTSKQLLAGATVVVAASGLVAGSGVATAASVPDDTAAVAAAAPHFAVAELGFNQGWRKSPRVVGRNKSEASHTHPRHVADVTGDGRADIVGFGDDGVWTAVATPGNGFGPAQLRLSGSFGNAQGWNQLDYRFVTNLNGDNRADLVGVGRDGVWTALATGDGGFTEPGFKIAENRFSSDLGIGKHGIFVADVDNDDDNDLIAVTHQKITVARSDGNGNFAAPFIAGTGFNELHMATPQVRDFNNDGRADILVENNSANGGTGIALAQPNLTFGSFVNAGGGRPDGSTILPDLLGDVNGDARPDIVHVRRTAGGLQAGTFVAFNRGDGTFNDAFRTNGTDSTWRFDRHEATLADVTGDGRDDLVMFAEDGVWVAVSHGSGFGPSAFVLADFGYSQSWREDRHHRVAVNINDAAGAPNRTADLIGFGDAGVYVAFATGDGGFN